MYRFALIAFPGHSSAVSSTTTRCALETSLNWFSVPSPSLWLQQPSSFRSCPYLLQGDCPHARIELYVYHIFQGLAKFHLQIVPSHRAGWVHSPSKLSDVTLPHHSLLCHWRLATRWSRLADVNSGSALKTYRQLQIEKAHLPIELWESDVFGPESDPNPW